MSRLTPVPRDKVIRAITRKYGWKYEREGGNHTVYVHSEHPEIITVPRHREVSAGVIRNIVKILEVTTAEFRETLRNC